MEAQTRQAFIRRKAVARQIKWSRHALSKLALETLTVDQVEAALQRAEVIEDYSHLHRYLPDCLVLGSITPQEPIHCVVALNLPQDYVLIVTVYRPTEREWKNDWQTRK